MIFKFLNLSGKKLMKSRKGFTLIELMISIAILVIGLDGVILVIPLAQKVAGRSALTTRAAILASEKTEELKAKGYTKLISQPMWNGTQDEFIWQADIAPVDSGDFEHTQTLPSDRLIKITMNVTYRSQGKQKTDVFTTFYSEL